MQTFVIVVHLMIVLTMIGFVLLQKSEGGGLGIGSTGGLLSGPGTPHPPTPPPPHLAGAVFAPHPVPSVPAPLPPPPGPRLRPRRGQRAAGPDRRPGRHHARSASATGASPGRAAGAAVAVTQGARAGKPALRFWCQVCRPRITSFSRT